MRDDPDPKQIVPKGAVLVGAKVNLKTGLAKHTVLMHEDVDPELLGRIMEKLPTLRVRQVKFGKLRLPPQHPGDTWRSYKHRIVVHADRILTNLDPDTARLIAGSAVSQIFRQMSAAVEKMADAGHDPLAP